MAVTIQDIIDTITESAPKKETTVDRLEYGNSDTIVKGVAVTFIATQKLIEKASRLGVNLLISHEGIFFSHWDKREMLKEDSVYLEKLKKIESSAIAIYRYHDAIHQITPDGIMAGLLNALKWQAYEVDSQPAYSVLSIPAMTVQDIISHMKKSLDLQYVRFIGDLNASCKRIGVFVGYRGSGELIIPLMQKENLDLLVYGEGMEWEAPEYIRDAVYQGKQKALIVLGHAESEAPGMKLLAERLQKKFVTVPIHFIPEEPIFQVYEWKK